MPVRIIVDSACDMSSADHPQLTVLPLTVAFGTTVYQDGVDLGHQRFYELLIESDELPSTGQVNPYAFAQAFEEAAAAGEDVVVIALSSKLSGTYQSAVTAASQMDAAAGASVRVVDSKNVTVGQHILVKYALQLVDQGLDAQHITDKIEAVRDRVVVIGLLDTLEYLRRGGRISGAAGTLGDMLSIKPVVTVEDGEVRVMGKARGSKNGRNLLTKKVEEVGGADFSMPIELGYAGLDDKLLRKYIEDSRALWEGYPEGELPVHSVGATIGTHVGPGAIALAFFRKA